MFGTKEAKQGDITLAAIKAEQSKISKLIETFEQQIKRIFNIPQQEIELGEGEEYAGIIIGEEGAPSHHLILLPGDESGKWASMNEWAKSIGGELPTRREQSLLYANLKKHFKPEWYWSSEQLEAYPYYAWKQDFDNGGQDYNHKDTAYRGRAVRRLPI